MLRPSEIVDGLRDRAEKLRLKRNELAALADLDENTVRRVFEHDTDPLIGTLDKLETAIAGEEKKVKDHLDEMARSRGGKQPDLFVIQGGGK